MNTLSAEQLTTTKSEVIPADEAVARVNALDWRLIGKDLDEQGSALLPGVLSARECQALAALYSNDVHIPQPRRHGTARLRARRVQVLQLPIAQPDSRSAYSALSLGSRPSRIAGTRAMEIDVRYPEESPGFSPAMPRCGAAAADASAPPVWRGRLQLPASGSLWGARLPDPGSNPAF